MKTINKNKVFWEPINEGKSAIFFIEYYSDGENSFGMSIRINANNTEEIGEAILSGAEVEQMEFIDEIQYLHTVEDNIITDYLRNML